jgi:cytochrome c oxidase cbb3-type subunit 4
MNMDINTLRVIATLASFAVFIGILVWVWRHRKTGEFAEAANLPFIDD